MHVRKYKPEKGILQEDNDTDLKISADWLKVTLHTEADECKKNHGTFLSSWYFLSKNSMPSRLFFLIEITAFT